MNSRKCILILTIGLVSAGTLFLTAHGCKKTGGKAAKDVAGKKSDSVAICVNCGQIKGSELCCKPDQIRCPDCGLVKDSPGCCKIPAGAADAAICTKCGQIKGSDLCCKPGQAVCAKCGLAKGSPGCCKIPEK